MKHRFYFYRCKKKRHPDSLDGPGIYKTPYRIYDFELENDDDRSQEGEAERYNLIEELTAELLPGKEVEVYVVDRNGPPDFSVESYEKPYFYITVDHKPDDFWFRI